MHYAVASYLLTPNPDKTAAFLADVLGFQIIQHQSLWHITNGTLDFRLSKGDQLSILEIQCSDIRKDSEMLLTHPQVHKRTEIAKHHHSLEQHLYVDCGLTLILIKHLDEDEREETPDLPTTIPWKKSFIQQAQQILRITPLAFREKARQNMTEHAEYLAVASGELEIKEPHIMQAFVEITPEFQHPSLFHAMQEQGVNAKQYLNPLTWEKDVCSNDSFT